jgi:uncharacterized protein involved in outer membrane biogenesis
MKFIQQRIEKKLTALFGANVSFERMKISPFAGKVEAENMTVAGESPDQPLLTIRRIEGQIAVAKALAGQISVKMLVVEGPEVFLMRRPDGSLSIPPRPVRFAAESESESESRDWEFDAESIRVFDGRIRFQRDSTIAAVEGINCELKCQNDQVNIAAIELRGKTDVNGWLTALLSPSAALKFPGPVNANVRVEITLPLGAIFPSRRG